MAGNITSITNCSMPGQKLLLEAPNMETQIFGFNCKNITSKKLQIIFCFLIHCYSTINLISNADLGLMYLLFNLI